MAFNSNARNTQSNVANIAERGDWKNEAFVNIRFRRPDGTFFKLGQTGSLGLKSTRKMDRTLIERAKTGDKEEIIRNLMSMIELDIVFVDDEAGADLGF